MSESDVILVSYFAIWSSLAWSLIYCYQHRARLWAVALMWIAAPMLLVTTFFILSELAIDRFYREMRASRIRNFDGHK